MFFTRFGYRVGEGGSPKGVVHSLLMQLFTPAAQISKLSKTDFFDIVTTQNGHPRYV